MIDYELKKEKKKDEYINKHVPGYNILYFPIS